MKYMRKLDYMDYRKSNEKAAITAALWFLWLHYRASFSLRQYMHL